MTFASVVDRESFVAEDGQEGLEAWDDGPNRTDVVALALEVAFWGAD